MGKNTHKVKAKSLQGDNGIIVYTPVEIQKIFNLSRTQTYNLMNAEGFPTIRINKKMLVEDSELRNWMKTYSGRKFIL